jgi:hypothetical protein
LNTTRSAVGELVQVEAGDHRRLYVYRQQQEKWPRLIWVVDDVGPPAQGGRQGGGRVQRIGTTAHGRAQAQEKALLGARDLLHIGPLVLGRLVAVDVPHTDAVAGRRQRGRQRLQRTWPDGGDDGRLLAGDPAQGGGGVGGLGFVADGHGAHDAMLLVGAQGVGESGRPVPEHTDVGAHSQAEQTEHHRLRHGDIGPARQRPRGAGRGQAAGAGDGRRSLLALC